MNPQNPPHESIESREVNQDDLRGPLILTLLMLNIPAFLLGLGVGYLLAL